MPRDLFGDVSDPSVRVGSRKWYTVPLSLAIHTVVLLSLIVIPLVATGTLPDPRTVIYVPVVPAVPPPPPPVRPVQQVDRKRADPNAPPAEAPRGIAPEPPDTGFEREKEIAGHGVVGGLDTDVPPPPPPPPPPAPAPQKAVPIGGNIRAPERTQYVAPVYPPIAQAARVQGMVIVEATIGIDGRVTNARLLRSIPLLDEAALAAVRQWTYKPTTLNGVPVPVIMTVTVNFQLQQ
jgi:protein TonB